jgi:hypothetical protein
MILKTNGVPDVCKGSQVAQPFINNKNNNNKPIEIIYEAPDVCEGKHMARRAINK